MHITIRRRRNRLLIHTGPWGMREKPVTAVGRRTFSCSLWLCETFTYVSTASDSVIEAISCTLIIKTRTLHCINLIVQHHFLSVNEINVNHYQCVTLICLVITHLKEKPRVEKGKADVDSNLPLAVKSRSIIITK